MTNQEKAVQIQNAMQALERNQARGVILSKQLHKLLDRGAEDFCVELGIDPVALSAGGNK